MLPYYQLDLWIKQNQWHLNQNRKIIVQRLNVFQYAICKISAIFVTASMCQYQVRRKIYRVKIRRYMYVWLLLCLCSTCGVTYVSVYMYTFRSPIVTNPYTCFVVKSTKIDSNRRQLVVSAWVMLALRFKWHSSINNNELLAVLLVLYFYVWSIHVTHLASSLVQYIYQVAWGVSPVINIGVLTIMMDCH